MQEHEGLTRTALAGAVCERFAFVDARGEPQVSTCLKALRDLEGQGRFELPPPTTGPKKPPTPRRLDEPVPLPEGVPATAGDVQDLHLVRVETDQHMRVWNELMLREHPRGAGPLVGRQLRYLIGSAHGWLGAVGFGAAALKLRARERWMGWDDETRRAQLHRVVGLSRLLIRPQGCRNLASRVLGLCLRHLPGDFEDRYGYRPWLVETFVDPEHFAGTCFRAANWEPIGQTQGRGRQDRDQARGESVKDIFLYSLEPSFRAKLGLPEPIDESDALAFDDGVEAECWAEAEFGGAPLGDRRLTRRLVASAALLAQEPGQTFSGLAKGDWAAVKGYYRLIDKPDESAVTMDNILRPHRDRTVRRMKAHETVLCIQDGTDLNYTGRPACDGLGVIGKNQTGAQSKGLHLHSTLAATTDGIPLGVLLTQCSAVEPKSKGEDRSSSSIPIEEKKTFSWIVGYRDCVELAGQLPETQLVSVMDREADFFELFDEHRKDPVVDLLVRAKHNRATSEAAKLFDAVGQTEVRSRVVIHVRRQSARPKKSKQKARPKRPERMATVAVRYKRIELRPPPYLSDLKPVAMWAIQAVEEAPPEGVKPLQWFLLTTTKLDTAEDAEACLRWYCLRWRIEDWHRVLKTGCRVEGLAHRSAERLERALAIYAVIAWRVMLMALLGREQPELPAEVLFSDLEIEVLGAFAKTRGKDQPSQLGEAVLLVAQLGGYLNRANDPPPGHQLLWHGYTQLVFMCMGYSLKGG